MHIPPNYYKDAGELLHTARGNGCLFGKMLAQKLMFEVQIRGLAEQGNVNCLLQPERPSYSLLTLRKPH